MAAPQEFDPDSPDWQSPGALAQNNATTLAPPAEPAPMPDFDPDAFLGSPAPRLGTVSLRPPETTAVPPTAALSGPTSPDQMTVGGEFDPDSFLKMGLPGKNIEVPNTKAEVSPLLKAAANASTGLASLLIGQNTANALDRTLLGTAGQVISTAGSILSQFDDDVDQNNDATNPYIHAGIGVTGIANTLFPDDPNHPIEKLVGETAANILPVIGASAINPALGRAIGAAEFGSQMYMGAHDVGASSTGSDIAGAVGVGLGGLLPSTNIVKSLPAVASASWGDLARNVGYGALLNASKAYWEGAGINLASGEVSNAVAPTPAQQTQWQVAQNALEGALPFAVVGGVMHLPEQVSAESGVSSAAAQAGKDKASFITGTTQAFDYIANNDAMSPQQKMQAVSGFLGQFSPSARDAIVNHVQNVHQTIDALQTASDQADELAKTNPLTAPALVKAQQDGAISTMVQKAQSIEEESDASEKAAAEALGVGEQEPEQANIADPVEGLRPENPDEIQQRASDLGMASMSRQEAEEIARQNVEHNLALQKPEPEKEPLPLPDPQPDAPVEGALPAEQYNEAQAKTASSPDEDVAARAQDLAAGRRQAVTELQQTESEPQKVALESEVRDNDSAMTALTQEPTHVQTQKEAVQPDQSAPNPGGGETPVAVPAEQGREPEAESVAPVAEPSEPEAAKPALPLEGLPREALEKVAAKEDVDPKDVQKAKGANALRDLISAKRLADAPQTGREDLASDQLEKIDPKFGKLTGKYQKAWNTFLDAARKYGLRGNVNKFVMGDGDGSTVWSRPRDGNTDTVFIDPVRLAKDIDTLKATGSTKAGIQDWFKRVFSEEFTHNQGAALLKKQWEAAGSKGSFTDFYDKKFASIYDEMTPKQRLQMAVGYGGDLRQIDITKQSKDMPIEQASRMGEEFFRQVIQRRGGKGVTEEAVTRIRSNKPLRTFLTSIVNRFKAIAAKMENAGQDHSQLSLLVKDYEDLIAGKTPKRSSEVPVEGSGRMAAAPSLDDREYAGEDTSHFFGGDEGVEVPEPEAPMKSAREASALKPFVNEGEPTELKPTGNEKLRSTSAISDQANQRESALSNKISAVKDVPVPDEKAQEFRDRTAALARQQFGEFGKNRDIAEANAYVKVMIEAKRWTEQHGSLDGFGSSRIIKNSLLDDGRRAARGETIQSAPAEATETPTLDEDGNPIVEAKPKGYDPSAQDYEAQQSQFEPVGASDSEVSHNDNPAKQAQDAIVDRNVKAVTSSFSPYGRRLLEIMHDTPDDPRAAFPPWVSKAAKEFGITKAKVLQDRDAIFQRVRDELDQRGLTKDDFARISPAPSLREEGVAKQVTNDEKMKDSIRATLANRNYEQQSNKASNDKANDIIARDGIDRAYADVMQKIVSGKPDATDAMIVFNLARRLNESPNGSDHARAGDLVAMYSTEATRAGQFTQAARAYSHLGANGALAKYTEIMKPVLDKAQAPYRPTIDPIVETLKGGKQDAANEAMDRQDKIGVTGKAEELAKKASQDQKPLWQQYKEATFDAIANKMNPRTASAKGALEEFSNRFDKAFKYLAKENGLVVSNVRPPAFDAASTVREIYNNWPEYKQAWDEAKQYLADKFKDDPQKMTALQNIENEMFDVPLKLQNQLFSEGIKSENINLRKLVTEWAGTQNSTRDALVKSIQDKMGLPEDKAAALGKAISDRFNERLQAAKKAEVQKILQNSPDPKISNSAPTLAQKIFKGVNLGMTEDQAVWEAMADKLKLPKYNTDIAADLANRAGEIQKMIANGEEGKRTDDKTNDMLNILANEAQKHASYLRQIGQGEMAVFYGNLFGLPTFGRKSISEGMNLLSEVGTMAAADMRHGDLLAIPRAYGAALRGLYDRGGIDFRSIMVTGRGMRQQSGGGYTGEEGLVERGKTFGNVPILSKLNYPLSLMYKPVGRFLYAAQAFFYAGNMEARANMLAWRMAKDMIAKGEVPTGTKVGDLVQDILGNSPEMRDKFLQQAANEGLKGRDQAIRAQELAEQQRPDYVQNSAGDFATRATFMQNPEGVMGVLYHGIAGMTNKFPPLKLLVPVARVVSNVTNNFLSYTPLGIGLPKFGLYEGGGAWKYAQEGKSDEAYQQAAKITVGALSTLALAATVGNNIQGSGPKDINKKKELMDEGWRPYTIKVGDKYISYREWPVALNLAALGTYYDQQKYNEGADKNLDTRLAMAMVGTLQFGFTSSWISSVNNALSVANPENYESFQKALGNLAGTTAGSLVPFNQKNLQVIDKIFDPSQYSPQGVTGALMSNIAFVRRDDGGRPTLNAMGEPISVSPVQAFYSMQNEDPVWSALADKGAFIPVASKSQKINGRSMSSDEHYDLVLDAGQAFKADMLNGGLEQLAGMTPEEAQAFVESTYKMEERRAKLQIEQNAPDASQGVAVPRRRER